MYAWRVNKRKHPFINFNNLFCICGMGCITLGKAGFRLLTTAFGCNLALALKNIAFFPPWKGHYVSFGRQNSVKQVPGACAASNKLQQVTICSHILPPFPLLPTKLKSKRMGKGWIIKKRFSWMSTWHMKEKLHLARKESCILADIKEPEGHLGPIQTIPTPQILCIVILGKHTPISYVCPPHLEYINQKIHTQYRHNIVHCQPQLKYWNLDVCFCFFPCKSPLSLKSTTCGTLHPHWAAMVMRARNC